MPCEKHKKYKNPLQGIDEKAKKPCKQKCQENVKDLGSPIEQPEEKKEE